jgi:hypothetical protein
MKVMGGEFLGEVKLWAKPLGHEHGRKGRRGSDGPLGSSLCSRLRCFKPFTGNSSSILGCHFSPLL